MVDEMMAFAQNLVYQYGNVLRTYYSMQVKEKTCCNDLVSEMDGWVEQQMVAQIKKQYPTHTCLGEEGDKQLSSHTWILDPIDGTTNYISKHRDFAISLAFYQHKKPILAIVYDVMRDEMFHAIHTKGAFCNEVALEKCRVKPLHESIVDISMGSMYHMRDHEHIDMLSLYPRLRGHRSLNCASLAICHIAQGLCDAYISSNVKCWDYAAAILILEECGGSYTISNDFFTTKRTNAYFACTRTLISDIQAFFEE